MSAGRVGHLLVAHFAASYTFVIVWVVFSGIGLGYQGEGLYFMAVAPVTAPLMAFYYARQYAAGWMPVWALALMVGIYVAPLRLTYVLLGRRQSRRERLAAGSCRACGYDLTGNVSGVCPECGTPTMPRNGAA